MESSNIEDLFERRIYFGGSTPKADLIKKSCYAEKLGLNVLLYLKKAVFREFFEQTKDINEQITL